MKRSRREALKLLGFGAAVALPAEGLLANDNPQPSAVHQTDVVVVGAGFAGMMAARSLIRSGKKVVVLEARNRVGGRVKPATLAGHAIDGGGMWVGPTQTRLLETIKEYGLHTRPQFLEGENILEIDGKRVMTDKEGSGMAPEAQAECDRVTAELDRITVEEWPKSQTRNQAVLRFSESATRSLFTADPYQISFLYFLFYLLSGRRTPGAADASEPAWVQG